MAASSRAQGLVRWPPEGGAAARKRRRLVTNGGGRSACRVRLVDRPPAAFAPARAHRATNISVKRGRGRTGAQGARQRAPGAGAGDRACAGARWRTSWREPSRVDALEVGRHQHRGVGVDGHRVCILFTPAQGVRMAGVSGVSFTVCVVGVQVAKNGVAGHDMWWKGRPRSVLPRGSPL